MDIDLTDIDGFIDGKRLILPINGRKIVIDEASGEKFLRLQRYGVAVTRAKNAQDPAVAEFATIAADEFRALVLGPSVLEQLTDADATGTQIDRVASTAFFWHIGQPEEVVRSVFQGSGKASAAKPRRPAKKAVPTTRGGAANTTRRRASGNGGKSRPR